MSIGCLEVSNLVSNWNKRKKPHFHGVDTSIMQIWNTGIHLQIYFYLLYFPIIHIEIWVNVWLLFAHPLMTSIIFHIRGPDTQENVRYILDFMFRLMFIFRVLRSWNHVFHFLPIRSRSYVLKSFGCLYVSNRVSIWKKRKNLFDVKSILQICQLEIPVIVTKLMSIICIFSLFLSKLR